MYQAAAGRERASIYRRLLLGICKGGVGSNVPRAIGAVCRLPVVFAGGVMSNSILREYFSKQYGAMFAEPQFSSDNAGGIGVLTAIKAGLG